MKLITYINTRFIRLGGNLIKILSIPFHWAFPNKRFTLPSYAKPWIKTDKPQAIPRIIWQTNFTNKVTLPVYINYLFNRFMAPKYEYRFMITADRRAYIAKEHPYALESYDRLTVGAAQADLWRILVLTGEGGIYLDIDACLVARPDNYIKPDMQELYVVNRAKRFTNYYLATAPDNPSFDTIANHIINNINDTSSNLGVYHMTGPAVVNGVLEKRTDDFPRRSFRYTVIQGAFTNEHFQYIDKPKGKWTHVKQEHIVKK